MKRRYAQIAEQTITNPQVPSLGMMSLYFSATDNNNLWQINSGGVTTPITAIRYVEEGGNFGFASAVERTNKSNIGQLAQDFSFVASAGTTYGASGAKSIAFGVDIETTNTSGIGIGTSITAQSGISIGTGIKTTDSNIGFGEYNIPGDHKFTIGDGEDDADRSNILELSQSGVLNLPKAPVDEIVNPKDVITLEYLTTNFPSIDDYYDYTFAIKGTIDSTTYPGFMPYIDPSISKSIFGWRYKCGGSGSINIKLVVKSGVSSIPLANFNVTFLADSQTYQTIYTDPAAYYNITDGDRIELQTTINSGTPEDLSVSIYVIKETVAATGMYIPDKQDWISQIDDNDGVSFALPIELTDNDLVFVDNQLFSDYTGVGTETLTMNYPISMGSKVTWRN